MINLVCFGDSITEEAEHPLQDRWTTLLQEKLDDVKSGAFQVHNLGISGNTTAQGHDRFFDDVLPLLPGVLLIEFGLNDANVYAHTDVPRVSLVEFERNLREFHRLAVSNDSVPVYILNHLIGNVDDEQGNGISFNDNFAPYNDMIQTLATEFGCHLINLPEKMRQQDIDLSEFVTDDQIHLTKAGNQYYAEMIYAGLNEISLN